MISVFLRKREIKLRQNILKAVYEDNLRIIGKAPRNIPRKIPFSLMRMFLFFAVILLTVLINENYLDISVFQEKQMAASISPQKSFLTTAGNQVSPKDYRAFLSIFEQKSFPPRDMNSSNESDYKAFLTVQKASLSKMFGLKVKTIMIDPGHGGFFSGAIGKMGTKEKDITLDIAKKLRGRLIKYSNFDVIMTRDQDVTVPLEKRVELARLMKADLFISIHINYLPSKPLNIIETYFFGPPFDNNTLKLAEHENADAQYGLSDFKEIIEKIGDTLKLQESKELAASIQRNLFLNIKKLDESVLNYGVKRAPFLVLLGVHVPAVLTEVSCLSNSDGETKLNTENYRENIAYYLEAGILDYLQKGEAIYEAKRR